jgi:hypothetical protein
MTSNNGSSINNSKVRIPKLINLNSRDVKNCTRCRGEKNAEKTRSWFGKNPKLFGSTNKMYGKVSVGAQGVGVGVGAGKVSKPVGVRRWPVRTPTWCRHLRCNTSSLLNKDCVKMVYFWNCTIKIIFNIK